jgi:hypothetical protein
MTFTHRLAVASAAALTAAAMGMPAVSAGTTQIGGTGSFDPLGTTCGPPPTGYEAFTSYPALVLEGDLDGCWYTEVLAAIDLGAPSGVYLETGRELFVGSVDGGPAGWFETTYRFESRWDPSVAGGVEVVGRCQHPIVAAGGGLTGADGRLDFKDVVSDGTYVYRGHIALT